MSKTQDFIACVVVGHFHIMMEPMVRLVVKTPCMLGRQADRHCKAWVLSRLSL